jgi:hypothetical protein
MSMTFYHYKVPEDSVLYRSFLIYNVFIVYNPVDGETAFFEVFDDAVSPFGPQAMKYVESKYHDWCIEHPDKATVACDKSIVMFDKEAFESFGKTLL